MILGLEDIPGGTAFVSFLIWLGLSLLFYLVCYVAVLNIIDDLTKDRWLKVPAMLAAAVPSAGLMAILNYKPLILCILVSVLNFHRVKNLPTARPDKFKGIKIDKLLFYLASYGYIFLMLGLAFYFPLALSLPAR